MPDFCVTIISPNLTPNPPKKVVSGFSKTNVTPNLSLFYPALEIPLTVCPQFLIPIHPHPLRQGGLTRRGGLS
jgi:hypothetical protein